MAMEMQFAPFSVMVGALAPDVEQFLLVNAAVGSAHRELARSGVDQEVFVQSSAETPAPMCIAAVATLRSPRRA